jgi:hypothetical protein
LDPGSTRTFIRTDVAQRLKAKVTGEEDVSIAGFGSAKRRNVRYKAYEVTLKLRDGQSLTIIVNGTTTISCPIQRHAIDITRHPLLKVLPLADPPAMESELVRIDLLLGADYYYDVVGSEQVRCGDGLILLDSLLGYVITGRTSSQSKQTDVHLLGIEDTVPNAHFDLERFWRLEDIGVKTTGNETNDDLAVKKFNDTVRFNPVESRYEVTWPWKDNAPKLPSNYGIALGRLKSLLKRLDNGTVDKYHQTIIDQFKKGVVEVAPEEPDGPTIHYIPHHCVIKADKATTKLRVVYDASCKARRDLPSLNDCLYRGPVLLADLCGLLLRFRMDRVAITSDVEKAFLQVALQKHDREVTRFLWLKDPQKRIAPANIITYRFRRVFFGAVSSPFLLAATIIHHLQMVDSPIARDILSNVYVDNVIGTRTTTQDAVKYYDEAKAMFKSASTSQARWARTREARGYVDPI